MEEEELANDLMATGGIVVGMVGVIRIVAGVGRKQEEGDGPQILTHTIQQDTHMNLGQPCDWRIAHRTGRGCYGVGWCREGDRSEVWRDVERQTQLCQ